jgi:AcrR family transcriptional regulator
MARVVDDELHESKRNAILDATERLLEAKGFERMSLADLLASLGMSKGAFYHYFESKQEVLVALVERRTAAVEARLRAIVEDRTLRARDKLLHHFAAVDDWKLAEGRVVSDVLRAWYTDDNVVVLDKLYVAGVERFAPLLAGIIDQGVGEGDFTTRYPKQAARMILCLRYDLGRALAHALTEKDSDTSVASLVEATADAIERLLGAAPGTVTAPTRDALARWRATSKKKRPRRARNPA